MSRNEQVLVLAQSAFIGLSAALMVIAPRLIPLLIGVLAVSCLIADISLPGPARLHWRQLVGPVSVTAVLFAGYALSSARWASNGALAVQSGLQVLALLGAAFYLSASLPHRLAGLDAASRRRYLRAVPLGVGIGLGFMFEEYLSSHRGMIVALEAFPGLAGVGRKGLIYSGNSIAAMYDYYINQNAAVLVLLSLPAVTAAALWLGPRVARPAIGAWLVVLALVVFTSESETAKLACITSLAAYLAARRWPTAAVTTVTVAFAAGLMLAPVLGRLPVAAGLDKAGWIPFSARDRMMLWDTAARTTMQSPMFGIGMQSTRFIKDGAAEQRGTTEASSPEGTAIPPRLGWHSHNAYLQSWLELGAVGVLLLLVLGVGLIRSTAQGPGATRPAALALAVAALTIAATGWGMWQPWLLAALVGAIVFHRIAETEAAA